ncbi:unnamed protein product [Ilex paraguariensis]|uniref:Uncharacterized protein n=1 Tax=Ilex paraguariensis TaxID=185542 RepID=A0ABC8TLF8_9AQUA
MCYGGQRLPSKDGLTTTTRTLPPAANDSPVVEDLRGRLAETEARLERARAREAELSRELEAMKRFVCVMEILETYLKRRFREQEERVVGLLSPSLVLWVSTHGADLGIWIVERHGVYVKNGAGGIQWKPVELVVDLLAFAKENKIVTENEKRRTKVISTSSASTTRRSGKTNLRLRVAELLLATASLRFANAIRFLFHFF